MINIKYMTSCSAERLMKHCREARDDSWYEARPGASVSRGKDARVFVKKGCRLTVASGASVWLRSGSLFILGDFALLPRSYTTLCQGMMVLGSGYLGVGSVMQCDEKLWIADADIGALCCITDTDGHRIKNADGSEGPMWSPTIIHEHVFIGPNTAVLKGSEIGAGTVVGPKSLVSGTLPEACYAAGMPAVPVEDGITWERRPFCLEEVL